MQGYKRCRGHTQNKSDGRRIEKSDSDKCYHLSRSRYICTSYKLVVGVLVIVLRHIVQCRPSMVIEYEHMHMDTDAYT
jgi:hypothetical protein